VAKILVTGCNRGIGLELCRELKERGDDVIGVCRTSSDALQQLGIRVIDGVDVAGDAGVARLKQAIGDEQIDILINNAGILKRSQLESLDFDQITEQFRVNGLGPLRVTQALLDNLTDGSKVVIITSRMGSIADNTSGGAYGYRMSKAAVNIAGVSLAHDLEPRGIAVVLLHPGMVATRMTGSVGIETSLSAGGLIKQIDELSLARTGSFLHAEGYELPW